MITHPPRVRDLVLYAPLGLARLCVEEILPTVRTEITDLRQQQPAARFIGGMAVEQLRTRAHDIVHTGAQTDCGHHIDTLRSFVMTKLGVANTSLVDEGEREPTDTSAPSQTPARAVSEGLDVAEPSAIPGYRDLSAPQVIALLADLRPEELSEVDNFERANRGRRTILNRIHALQAD